VIESYRGPASSRDQRVRHFAPALIAASKANIPLTFKQATAIDLAGRDVLDAVRTSVHPRSSTCPDPRAAQAPIDAVAMDGIQFKAKARVTVRTNIPTLVGGATEETIIARVGEGIVTTIGSAQTHKEVLENPDTISKNVLEGASTRAPPSRSSPSTSPTSTSARTSAPLQIRPGRGRQANRPGQAPKSARAMAQPRESEMKAQVVEMRARWSWPRPSAPRPRRCASARATWASWTTTASRTSRPTRHARRHRQGRPPRPGRGSGFQG
jgi:uncharacterized protein YqfA (UPF0365 family)